MDGPARARLLVVDDEPDIRGGLRALFEKEIHAEVVEAASGPAALQAMAKGRFNAILSDYKMPVMDGLRFLEEAQKVAPGTPRIMMTAYPDMELALEALNDARILHFFTKPLDPDHLIEVFRKVLEAESAVRQRDEALQRSLEMMRRKVGLRP